MNTPLRARRLAALAVVGALALASCSSGGDDAAEKTTPTKAEKTTTTDKKTPVTGNGGVAGSAPGYFGKRKLERH